MGEKFKSCKLKFRIAKKYKERDRARRRNRKTIARVNDPLIQKEDNHRMSSRRERREDYVESLQYIRRRTTGRISRRITHGRNVKIFFVYS